MTGKEALHFPPGFVWGAASSAYQIEGAWQADGRGLSIWDTFSHTPGKIERGEDGDIAADHYHRWEEDVQIMAELGLNAYRFSIAWPRILPEGRGRVNQAGLDFYDRLVDALLEKNIQPFPTLYHWDLPQALQDEGGWISQKIVNDFGEYAAVVARKLGDRVNHWITHNEPMVAALLGHYMGIHAPGIQDARGSFTAGLHLLLSHRNAVQALRANCPAGTRVGITLNLAPVHPASHEAEDIQAAQMFDLVTNRFFLDPVLKGTLPDALTGFLNTLGVKVDPAELKSIAEPVEFLGINYYTRNVIRYDPQAPFIQAAQVSPEGREYSGMWEIYPEGIFEILEIIQKEYLPITFPGLRLMITENGIPVPDGIDFDGRVRDERRIRYLQAHIAQLHRAIEHGIPLDGYFVWSLTDNFEWAFGYRMRFGMVYIDFESLERTIKDSGRWYAGVIRKNGLIE